MGFFQPPRMPFDEKPCLVTDEDLGAFREQEGASLRAIKGLQELDLTGCSKLTDISITQVCASAITRKSVQSVKQKRLSVFDQHFIKRVIL